MKGIPLLRIATSVGVVFQDPESQLFLARIESELAFGPENLCIPPEEIKHIFRNLFKYK